MKLYSKRAAEHRLTLAGDRGKQLAVYLEISMFGGGPLDPHGQEFILRLADWRSLSIRYLTSLADEVPNVSPLKALHFGTAEAAVKAAAACDSMPGATHWSIRATTVRAELARQAAHRN